MKKQNRKEKNSYVNKYANKGVAFVLLAVMFVSIFAISSHANPEKSLENKTILEHHFDLAGIDGINNDYVVPPNVSGSCGYVAMSMLLSYYDTYWHKDFISEDLEWDEGTYNPELKTLNTTFNAESEKNEFDDKKSANNQYSFTDFVNEYSDTYLQPHLISYYRNLNSLLSIPGLFAILADDMVDVLRNYLYNECHFTENEVVVNIMYESESGDSALYNKMKEQIALGNPLIYYGSVSVLNIGITNIGDWSKVGGHYMIAYDISTESGTEDIKLNIGYNAPEASTTVMLSNCEYTNNNAIIWLEINKSALAHEHDKNYILLDTTTYLCACEIYSTHPNHNSNHIYVDGNEYYNDSYHWGACHCGVYDTPEEHSFSYINLSSNHEANCTECGYSYIEGHEYTIKRYKDMNNHELMCACYQGSGIIEGHYAYEYIYSTKFAHRIVCECGFAMGMATHTMVTDGPTQSHCAECGAVFNTGSDIIIKRKEEDQEMM